MPHIIRLRGPWECEALGAGGDGPLRHSRRFHKPTGLEAGSRVWLVVEEVEGEAEVKLNGQVVGKINVGACPARFDITTEMKANNLIEITVKSEERGDKELGLVKLEIEESEAPSKTTGRKDLAQRHGGTEE